jgi:hypothetical protein
MIYLGCKVTQNFGDKRKLPQKIWSNLLLESAWATKATTTWASTHRASEATTTATATATTRAATKATLASGTASEEVQTIDDVNHTVAGDSVILGIGTHRGGDRTREV